MINYSGEYFNYKQRFLKQSTPVIFLAVLAFTFMLANSLFRVELKYWIIFLVIFGTLAFFVNRNAKNYVYEVEIDESTILLRGETYYTEWDEIVNLDDIELNFKFVGSRFTVKYILNIKCGENNYYINEYQDWNYQDLIKMFEKIKEQKNEKINLDDRIILNRIKEI